TVSEMPAGPADLIDRLGLPIIFKPRTVEDKHWVRHKTVVARTTADVDDVYSRYGSDLRRFVAQECIPGADPAHWVCDCVFDRQSDVVAALTFQKLHTSPPHFGVTSLGVS